MLTQKQEKFTRLLFLGRTQREAWKLAGYSTNYPPEDIDANACKLASVTKIKQRLNELRDKAAEPDISTYNERRLTLTEIERARVADFVDESGNLSIGSREALRNAAVQEIKTERTIAGVRTTLKLRDPVSAITEHNKMEKVYETAPIQDNRQINVYVVDKEAKELLGRIGERLDVQRRIEAEGE